MTKSGQKYLAHQAEVVGAPPPPECDERPAAASKHAPARGPPSEDDLLTSTGLKASLGGISEMTLWRWTRERGFPKPDLVIGRRKFWRRATVQKWLRVQAGAQNAG